MLRRKREKRRGDTWNLIFTRQKSRSNPLLFFLLSDIKQVKNDVCLLNVRIMSEIFLITYIDAVTFQASHSVIHNNHDFKQ